MKIVFFGNPEFSARCLSYLNEFNDISIELVVTNKDKRMGRGLSKKMTAVKKTAMSFGNKLYEIDKINTEPVKRKLKSVSADLFIIVGYKYIPKSIYTLSKKGSINLHASLLPKYRGASPIQYALLNGDKVTGLTTFYINEQIDEGRIIYQLQHKINDTITFNNLYDELASLSKKVLLKTISIIKTDDLNNHIILDIKSYDKAPKIKKDDFQIDWNQSAYKIHNQIRAFSYRGAYSYYSSKRIKFYNTYFIKNTLSLNIKEFIFKDNIIYIGTSNGILTAKMIQLEGKNKISPIDFKNTVKNTINKFD